MKAFRKLYDWVLSWAETPYGGPALFLLAFAEASFFPVPPDVLLIALCLALPARSYRYALIACAGSVIGGAAGYALGLTLWGSLEPIFFQYVPGFSEAHFQTVREQFVRHDFLAIFAAGFTPIPYKIFTVSAGVFNLDFPLFVIASCLSRGLRFLLVAWLLHRFGSLAKTMIDKYFNLLTILFLLLLVGGFVVIEYFL
ncbi:MAG: cytochrome B [Desulfuromonas sp.]|mgnify:CR=1 FL=1|nr:MAG: cytochrome B [Desulfuromonas sp.]